MKITRRRFTYNEIEFIRKNRGVLTVSEIAEKINRPPQSVHKYLKRNNFSFKRAARANNPNLTSMEEKVIELFAEGLTDKEVAEKLTLEVSTIITHKNNIYQKYNTHGSTARVKAVLKWLKLKGRLNNEYPKDLTDGEKLQACCKILAQILSKQAETLNSDKINYFLEEITDKETGKFFGNIKVEWNNDR